MKKLSSYLIIMLIIFFWGFRITTCLTNSMGMEFFAKPLNETTEIILLFATIITTILIIKRKVYGSLIYLALNWIYFGVYTYTPFMRLIRGGVMSEDIITVAISVVGIILPIVALIDVLADRKRASSKGGDKKTDWFYKNKDFDRKIDDRADKNQYKIN